MVCTTSGGVGSGSWVSGSCRLDGSCVCITATKTGHECRLSRLGDGSTVAS